MDRNGLLAVDGLACTAFMCGFATARVFEPAAPARRPPEGRCVALGREYMAELRNTYALAWYAGALDLEHSVPMGKVLERVAAVWAQRRVELFDRLVTPEFARIVPEEKKDEDVTATERWAMARAWHDFADGLRDGP
jgi:hypothetical protein